MTRVLIEHPPGREAERGYALDVVLSEFVGVDHVARPDDREDVRITLDDGSPGEVRVADVFLAAAERDWLARPSLPRLPLETLDVKGCGLAPRVLGDSLPVLYGHPLDTDARWVCCGPRSVVLGLDVFGSAFFMLTRYEEIVVAERDAHDRFPATAAVAARGGFLDRPIVDEYAEVLWTAMKHVWPRVVRRRREFRFLPSHDVDWPRSPRRNVRALGRTLAGDVLRRRDPHLAVDRLRAERRTRNGDEDADLHNQFEFLMDVSDAAGARSAFYFQPLGTDPLRDAYYDLSDPWLGGLMRRIHERGHEVGIHPTYTSYREPEQIVEQVTRLRAECERLEIEQERWGGRQHFLRWENPTTWQAWADAGLDYDSTVGFADRVGFRAGACREYAAFNLRTRSRLALRERPLVIMEGSLFDYEGASLEQAREKIWELREKCRAMAGDFTLLWHNSSLLSRRERRFYREIALG